MHFADHRHYVRAAGLLLPLEIFPQYLGCGARPRWSVRMFIESRSRAPCEFSRRHSSRHAANTPDAQIINHFEGLPNPVLRFGGLPAGRLQQSC